MTWPIPSHIGQDRVAQVNVTCPGSQDRVCGVGCRSLDNPDVGAHRADRPGLVDEPNAAVRFGVRQRVEVEG